jgi:glucose-induced degradation protein 4
MPTPSSDQTVDERSLHSSCPPEDDRSSSWRTSEIDEMRREDSTAVPIGNQQHSIPLSDSHRSPDLSDANPNEQRMKQMAAAEESQTSSSDVMSPVSVEDTQEDSEQSEHPVLSTGYTGGSSSMSNEFSNVRVRVLRFNTPLNRMLI